MKAFLYKRGSKYVHEGSARRQHELIQVSSLPSSPYCIMSLDLAWEKLDDALATRLVELLNKQLAVIQRPSFIGPVEVTSVDFGTVRPDVQVVDMRDIYRDFLEDDEDTAPNSSSTQDPTKLTDSLVSSYLASSANAASPDDDFEWVSRRVAQHGMAHEAPALHHLPPHGPHLRYGARAPSSDFLTSLPGMHYSRDFWAGGANTPGVMGMSVPNLGLGDPLRRPGFGSLQGMGMGMTSSLYATRAPSPLVSPPIGPMDLTASASESLNLLTHSLNKDDSRTPSPDANDNSMPAPKPTPHPDLQLHLRILYHSDIRLSLNTSLLINYPSPMFMTLPIKLCVTGFLFDGEVVVAYEGSRRRVHFCILDDLDPYGPVGDRSKRSNSNSESSTTGEGMDVVDPTSRPTKPLPVGQRLLPQIFIESEIGQTDKHVLKNVARVERFIQDVIRKTVEDELVFPNFHTLILGDS